MAYLVSNGEGTNPTYTLYIQGNDLIYLSSGKFLFSDFNQLEGIEGIEYVDTSQVTDMDFMFKGCSSLTNLDVSQFDTSQVTDMGNMFEGCSRLTNLDVSHFDTSQVTNIRAMFSQCNNLINLDFRNATFILVTVYDVIFNGVPSTIQVTVKDSETQTWIQDRLGSGIGTVIIA